LRLGGPPDLLVGGRRLAGRGGGLAGPGARGGGEALWGL